MRRWNMSYNLHLHRISGDLIVFPKKKKRWRSYEHHWPFFFLDSWQGRRRCVIVPAIQHSNATPLISKSAGPSHWPSSLSPSRPSSSCLTSCTPALLIFHAVKHPIWLVSKRSSHRTCYISPSGTYPRSMAVQSAYHVSFEWLPVSTHPHDNNICTYAFSFPLVWK